MSDEDASDTSSETLARSVSILAIFVLSFLGGAMTTEFESFPYPQLLERPFRALESYIDRFAQASSPNQTDFWFPLRGDERFQQKGTTRHLPDRAYEGYTLYTSAHESASRLVDMQGRVVHEWRKPFREVWDDPPHIDRPVEPSMIHFGGTHLFPDGDLLVNYTADGDTPYGYGLIRLDRESNLEWRYAGKVHHDFDVGSDGSIYTLIHRMRDIRANPVPGIPDRERFVLEDVLVRLSEEGEELERLSLFEAFASSPRYQPMLDHWFGNEEPWDTLHANNVERIPEDFAEHHDFAEPGQLLLSFRSLHAIALLDPEIEQIVWAQRGPWVRQHDPDPLPNGHILIYDNQGHMGEGGVSRLLEFDPAAHEIVWRYTGDAQNPFETHYRGKQMPLPNGNVLVAESNAGRMFEVTRDGTIAWEFINPARTTYNGYTLIAAITGRVTRIPGGELTFDPMASSPSDETESSSGRETP